MSSLYSPDRQAKLAKTELYLKKAVRKTKPGSTVTLTGNAPVWLYLKIAHTLHGIVKTLYYESPVTGKVEVFNHDPHIAGAKGNDGKRKTEI